MKRKITYYDLSISSASFISLILDVGTDIAVAVLFYTAGHAVWGSITLGLVAASTFIMQVFSFHWHALDKALTWKTFLIHIFFLAPYHRYFEVLKLGVKARQTCKLDDLAAAFKANNDVGLLRLVQIFLESGPQLMVQMYIIVGIGSFSALQCVSVLFSLISMSWSLTAYLDGLRLLFKEEHKRKVLSVLAHTSWHMLMIAARVVAVVVFTTHFRFWIILPISIHWLICTCWITVQNADFGDNACEKRIFNTVAGYIYIFCFLNFKDGTARCRLSTYHILVLAENTLLVILWFHYKPATTPLWLGLFTLSIVYGGFLVGGMIMLLYYACCHPSGPKSKAEEDDEISGWFRRLQNLHPKKKAPIFEQHDQSFRVAEWLNASMPLSNEANSRDVSRRPSADYQFQNYELTEDPLRFLNSRTPLPIISQRTPSIESALNYLDGYLTVDSGKTSILSTSSMHQLLKSSSEKSKHSGEINEVMNYSKTGSYLSHSYVTADINQVTPTLRETLHLEKLEGKNLFPKAQTSGSSGIGQDCSGASASERIFALTGSSANSSFNKNHPNTSSFYSSPEITPIKRLSLSPLDPVKLWETTLQGSYHICPLSDVSEHPSVQRSTHTPGTRMTSSRIQNSTSLNSSSGHDTSSFQDLRIQSRSTSARSTDDSGYSNLRHSSETQETIYKEQHLTDVSNVDSTISTIYKEQQHSRLFSEVTTPSGMHVTSSLSNISPEGISRKYSLSLPLLDQIQTYRRNANNSITFSTDNTEVSTVDGTSISEFSKPHSSTRSTLPGLSYLMDCSDLTDSFVDNAQAEKNLSMDHVDASGSTLGDHGISPDKESMFPQETQLRELTESPYKFRSKESKEAPKYPLLSSPHMEVEKLTQSPYKFRLKSDKPFEEKQDVCILQRETEKTNLEEKMTDEDMRRGALDKENIAPDHRVTRTKRMSKRRLSSPTLKRLTKEKHGKDTTSKCDGHVITGKVSQVKHAHRHKNSRNVCDGGDSGYRSRIYMYNTTPKDSSLNKDSDGSSVVNYSSSSNYPSTDDSDIVIDHSKLVWSSTAARNYEENKRVFGGVLRSIENSPHFSPIEHDIRRRRGDYPDGEKVKPTVSTPVENPQRSLYQFEDVEAPLSMMNKTYTVDV